LIGGREGEKELLERSNGGARDSEGGVYEWEGIEVGNIMENLGYTGVS